MTGDDGDSVEAMREAAASQFDRELDPLAKFEDGFEDAGIDPFYMFASEVLKTSDITEGTINGYQIAFDQWASFMQSEGRHPACPNEQHVHGFVDDQRNERNNTDQVIRQKLHRLNRAYEYMQNDEGLPHPTDVNPFEAVLNKLTLGDNEKKPVPRIPVERMREIVGTVQHVGYRAIIGTQLKLGLRRGELCNIKLSELNLSHPEVIDFYDQIGTDPRVSDRPNSILIPADREGNKSKRPRVLPLDDELRSLLIRYLLIRPTVEEPWVFLAKRSYGQLRKKSVNAAWKEAFGDLDIDDRYREITSHYGRHFFSNHWETELSRRGLPLKYVQYMRGDRESATDGSSHSIDHYLQSYYEDVKDVYLDDIYRLGLSKT